MGGELLAQPGLARQSQRRQGGNGRMRPRGGLVPARSLPPASDSSGRNGGGQFVESSGIRGGGDDGGRRGGGGRLGVSFFEQPEPGRGYRTLRIPARQRGGPEPLGDRLTPCESPGESNNRCGAVREDDRGGRGGRGRVEAHRADGKIAHRALKPQGQGGASRAGIEAAKREPADHHHAAALGKRQGRGPQRVLEQHGGVAGVTRRRCPQVKAAYAAGWGGKHGGGDARSRVRSISRQRARGSGWRHRRSRSGTGPAC